MAAALSVVVVLLFLVVLPLWFYLMGLKEGKREGYFAGRMDMWHDMRGESRE